MKVLVRGHEVDILVTHFVQVKPNPHTWDSDLDFYGYTECEWEFTEPDQAFWKGYMGDWEAFCEEITEKAIEACLEEAKK